MFDHIVHDKSEILISKHHCAVSSRCVNNRPDTANVVLTRRNAFFTSRVFNASDVETFLPRDAILARY